ncbi:MAG: GxxExxY protein [Saprospiraceae bacterium]|nr:GxxExxY protein [Saprospiraceae bacterium]
MAFKHQELCDGILKTFYHVYNELGYGFLEKVYQNSLYMELKNRGYNVEAQKKLNVFFKGKIVGVFYADLVVDEVVLLELKAAECIVIEFEQQVVNYLRSTDIEVGYILNFGHKPEFKRKIFDNEFKKIKSV